MPLSLEDRRYLSNEFRAVHLHLAHFERMFSAMAISQQQFDATFAEFQQELATSITSLTSVVNDLVAKAQSGAGVDLSQESAAVQQMTQSLQAFVQQAQAQDPQVAVTSAPAPSSSASSTGDSTSPASSPSATSAS